MGDGAGPIEDTIDDIKSTTEGEAVSLGELLDKFESRSLGAILLIFGLFAGLPITGAIPGAPDVAAVVVLIAVFHSFVGGQQRFWAPQFIRRREIERDKVDTILEWIRPVGRWIDALVHRDRLRFLVESPPARVLIAIAAVVLAILMFTLSLIPFAATPVAIGYMVFGLALMGRDGLFALAGYFLIAICAVLLALLWNSIFGSG